MSKFLVRCTLAVAIVLLTSSVGVPKVSANHNLGHAWDMSEVIQVCIDDEFTETQMDVIGEGVNRWFALNPPAVFIKHGGCIFEDVFVEAVDGIFVAGSAASSGCTNWQDNGLIANNGSTIDKCTHAVIKFNQDIMGSFHWGTGVQNCTVSSTTQGCDFDARTIATHEYGHVLGLGHHFHPGEAIPSTDRCVKGYQASEINSACDGKSRAFMFNYSGVNFQDYSSGHPLSGTSMDSGTWVQEWQGYRTYNPKPADEAKFNAYYPTTDN